VCVSKNGQLEKKKYFLNRTEKVGRSSFKAITHPLIYRIPFQEKREKKLQVIKVERWRKYRFPKPLEDGVERRYVFCWCDYVVMYAGVIVYIKEEAILETRLHFFE